MDLSTRVGLSPLKVHKKLHNFQDTPDGTCLCTLNAETTLHFLLECPNFNVQRYELFEVVNPIIMANDMYDVRNNKMVHLLLYGHEKLNLCDNKAVLKATINFIGKSGRFSQD